ncbi:hypothetical protein F383_17081 [Gossypium arboreum]|uniref:Uncharacterized protein n=1 Tax=Gossypium arboreum TaxID=29729 RepID=A0A0B0NF19_GOSAR|nr:hypothetical protein F383_17081 [Gossypium arboreum]
MCIIEQLTYIWIVNALLIYCRLVLLNLWIYVNMACIG